MTFTFAFVVSGENGCGWVCVCVYVGGWHTYLLLSPDSQSTFA